MAYILRRQFPKASRTALEIPNRPSWTHSFITAFSRAHDPASLIKSFEEAAHRLGFSHYVIAKFSRAELIQQPDESFEIISIHYPEQWVQHYQRNNYAVIDPVHRAALVRTVPYRWRDIANLSTLERRVLDEARDAGLSDGMSIPIHEPMGRVLLFSLSSDAFTADAESMYQRLYLLSTQFHLQFERLKAPLTAIAQIQLTQRERDCLTWTARGKSSWDIGRLMGISEHTVNYHLKRAMEKLHTHSRVEAAVRAATKALIWP
ncbi:LuxR family transcriptional regulator [Paraburkholderia sp. BL10I2N1]|uniref:LuxR family transcriptional regulator n=1 Tax=Paraburkholderia sp. BL10I2N1 TaxID=1938796 RepID=UPI00105B5669|nr:LuxR family transcriptional regulator [Paraburkholderia sp. BL10I2N1]TDN67158.1 LuxR family transcriptional regulator [Paraburkholderia sp. BL10I2N1]